MNTPDEIRAWAREQAAKLPPLNPAEVRRMVLLARELDSRSAAAA